MQTQKFGDVVQALSMLGLAAEPGLPSVFITISYSHHHLLLDLVLPLTYGGHLGYLGLDAMTCIALHISTSTL
jgi:hypothetical protein